MARTKKSPAAKPELVIITGLSGSGKGSVLKSLEDLGFYSVDNLPVELIPKFAELTRDNPSIGAAALVVDIREGEGLKQFPSTLASIRKSVSARLIFLEADEGALVRRFSETRRPHPLGADRTIVGSIRAEKEHLAAIRSMADLIINTSKFTVHELREYIGEQFRGRKEESKILVYVTSFGFKNRGTAGERSGIRRPLPAESQLHSALQAPHGAGPGGCALHSVLSPNGGIYRAHFRVADLPAAALHPRGQELSDDRLRMYGRTASLGDDSRPDPQEPGGGRFQSEGKSPRRSETARVKSRAGGRVLRSRTHDCRANWLLMRPRRGETKFDECALV